MAPAEGMDRELLQRAQQNLRILDVSLRRSRCVLAEGFDPRHEGSAVDVEYMQHTARSEVLGVMDGNDERHELFRVFVELGVRWVRRPSRALPSGRARAAGAQRSEPEPDVVASIEATYMAEYEMMQATDRSALDEFARCNAPWNVWPFWREYVASHTGRMNLPRLAMPLQGLRPNPVPATEVRDTSTGPDMR